MFKMRLPRTRIIGSSELEEQLEHDRAIICRSKGGDMFSTQWKLFIDVMGLVHGKDSVKTIYAGPSRGTEPKPTFKIEDLVEKYHNPDAGFEMQETVRLPEHPKPETDYHALKQKAKKAVKRLYSVGAVKRFVYDVLRVLGRDVYAGKVRKVKDTVKALIDDDASDISALAQTLLLQAKQIFVEKNNCTYLANRITETQEGITAVHGERKKAEAELKKYHDLTGEFPENNEYALKYGANTRKVESLKLQTAALAQQVLSDGNRLINGDRAITVSEALLDYSTRRIGALEERKQRFRKFYESISYHADHPMLCLPSVPFELRMPAQAGEWI
jgi:hypothetical protein